MKELKALLRSFMRGGAIWLYHYKLLPNNFVPRVEGHLLWAKSQLQWNNKGYWYIDPMPSTDQLQKYYETNYWRTRGNNHPLVTSRDMGHFLFLKPFITKNGSNPWRVLNFGAGHGGISFLLLAMGHEVVNVEPSDMVLPIGWLHHKDIRETSGSFDLIYASQSLEHVLDVEETIQHFRRILNPGGLVFIEVPNCHRQNRESYPENKIHPPHTYYFTRDFFDNLEFQILLNKTFDESHPFAQESTCDDGQVIRFLAMKKAKLSRCLKQPCAPIDTKK